MDIFVSALPSIVTSLIMAAIGFLAGRLRTTRKQDQAVKNGVKCLLRLKIIDLCSHYAGQDTIPPYGMENILTVYQAYVDCGDGDPSVGHMVNQLKAKAIVSKA